MPLLWQADRAEGVKAAAWDLFTEAIEVASDGVAGLTVPSASLENLSGPLGQLK